MEAIMQIDFNNINFNTPDNNLNGAQKPAPAGNINTDSADSALRSEYASVIAQSLAAEEIDTQAVTAAREALQSGQLDSPQAIQSAAENLLKFGI